MAWVTFVDPADPSRPWCEDAAVTVPVRPAASHPHRVESPGADVLRRLGLEALIEFLETTAYGVCVTGDDHTWVYINPAGERILGRPLTELAGKDYLLHFPPHEREVLLALEATQRTGDTDFYTNTIVREDTDDVQMTWSGTVMHVEGNELAPAIFHETTPVRLAQVSAAELGAAAVRADAEPARGDVLASLTEEAVAATRASAAVLLCEDERGHLQVAAATGHRPELAAVVASAALGLDDVVTETDLSRGRSVFLSDIADQLAADPQTTGWVEPLCAEPWNGGAVFSVWCDGRAAGFLLAMLPATLTAPSERELALWSSLADQASVALGAQRVRAHVSAHSALSERHRIARDLHDSVSQALFSLHARAQVVRRALAADDPALATEAAQDLELLARQATTEMRALLTEPRPAPEDCADLVPRLRELADGVHVREGLPVELTVRPADLPPFAATTVEHLARVAGEAVHNAVKHAAATGVRVRVTLEERVLTLVVQDDGRGFDSSETSAGLGQRTMRERAELLGGALEVRSAPGGGTTVRVTVPLDG